ncbi:MAG: twin-arginine translocation signal domain-containing protein, partial [Acetobacteraceae bacterium]
MPCCNRWGRKMTLSRRTVLKGGAAAVAAAAPGIRGAQAASNTKILNAVMQGDLRSFDPIWTTANITAYYGAMVYDTLFSMDAEFRPQPQMVGKWG